MDIIVSHYTKTHKPIRINERPRGFARKTDGMWNIYIDEELVASCKSFRGIEHAVRVVMAQAPSTIAEAIAVLEKGLIDVYEKDQAEAALQAMRRAVKLLKNLLT